MFIRIFSVHSIVTVIAQIMSCVPIFMVVILWHFSEENQLHQQFYCDIYSIQVSFNILH